MLARFALFGLLLCALPAHAAQVTYKNCAPEQETAIAKVITDLQQQLSVITSWLREGSLHAYVRAWFGMQTTESEVDRVLTTIIQRFSQPPSLIFTCVTMECKPGLMGYAGAHETNLCPDFFNKPRRDGTETQLGMLVHELSHLTANTRDYVYGRIQAKALAAQRPDLAPQNADNYQYFVEAVLTPDIYSTLPVSPANSCVFAFDGACDEGSRGRYVCVHGSDTADCSQQPTPQQSSAVPRQTEQFTPQP